MVVVSRLGLGWLTVSAVGAHTASVPEHMTRHFRLDKVTANQLKRACISVCLGGSVSLDQQLPHRSDLPVLGALTQSPKSSETGKRRVGR